MQPKQRLIEVGSTNVRGIEERLQTESAQGWQYVKAEPFYMLGRVSGAGMAYHTHRFLLLLAQDDETEACYRVESLRREKIPARRSVADEVNARLEEMALCGFELFDLLPMLAFSSDPEYAVHPTGGYILIWGIRASAEILRPCTQNTARGFTEFSETGGAGVVLDGDWVHRSCGPLPSQDAAPRRGLSSALSRGTAQSGAAANTSSSSRSRVLGLVSLRDSLVRPT